MHSSAISCSLQHIGRVTFSVGWTECLQLLDQTLERHLSTTLVVQLHSYWHAKITCRGSTPSTASAAVRQRLNPLHAVCAATTLCAKYNDIESVKQIFADNKDEIAGVILEPVVGNSGFIAPTQEFLQVGW